MSFDLKANSAVDPDMSYTPNFITAFFEAIKAFFAKLREMFVMPIA